MRYQAPVPDLLLSLRAAGAFPPEAAFGLDDAQAVLGEAATVAAEVLLPLDAVGDQEGLTVANGAVTMPPGWRDAYQTWRAGGWNGVCAPLEAGGMALPLALNAAALEIWSSANASFALGPVLTMGAVEALRRHGAPALQALYLARLVSGEWMGTMNLTEPQAGSDLGALRARAEPAEGGSYRITGEKIFITYGEHDLSDNIVHLVLARLPDAPAGHRGISLFLVPKFIPDADGRAGRRNALVCTRLERKLGMHASPTCAMTFDGATGWLVGEPHRGLACMFTMMNSARLAVGLQGVAAAERATQLALAYARTRQQGRSAASPDAPSPILHHPDVARMLMLMQADTMAARAICHRAAVAIDRGEEARASLLIPLAKAYATDLGFEVASLGVQVHGGMGYIEDAGAAQILRDVRIASIYEGTNGIQAIDLSTRKLPLENGAVAAAEIADMRATVDIVRGTNRPGLGATAERLAEAVDAFEELMQALSTAPADTVLAAATPTLRVFALARGGTALVAMAMAGEDGRIDALARFFAEQRAPEAAGLVSAALAAGRCLEGAARVWG